MSVVERLTEEPTPSTGKLALSSRTFRWGDGRATGIAAIQPSRSPRHSDGSFHLVTTLDLVDDTRLVLTSPAPDPATLYGLPELEGNAPTEAPFDAVLDLIDAARLEGAFLRMPPRGDLLGEPIPALLEQLQDAALHDGLAAVQVGDRWGFSDAQGRLVIPARFNDVRPFHEGFAAVRVRWRWGYIDRFGASLLEPSLQDARDFCNGLAAVMQGGQWGFLDTQAEEAVPCRYEKVEDFTMESWETRVLAGGRWQTLKHPNTPKEQVPAKRRWSSRQIDLDEGAERLASGAGVQVGGLYVSFMGAVLTVMSFVESWGVLLSLGSVAMFLAGIALFFGGHRWINRESKPKALPKPGDDT